MLNVEPFVLSLSEANFNMSSASEPDTEKVDVREKGGTCEGGIVEDDKEENGVELKLASSTDSVYNIHLSLPGVSQLVDVVVSRCNNNFFECYYFSSVKAHNCFLDAAVI